MIVRKCRPSVPKTEGEETQTASSLSAQADKQQERSGVAVGSLVRSAVSSGALSGVGGWGFTVLQPVNLEASRQMSLQAVEQ